MTEALSPKESNDRLFWPRTHEDTRTLAEVLRTAPEYPLSDSEKERIIAFENQLFQGNIEGLETTRSLANYIPLVDASFSVSSEYLETQEGAEMVTSILQQEGRSDVASSNLSEELSVMSFADLQSHKEAIKKMQGRSQQYTEALYIEMAKGVIPEREFHSVNFALKPQETIDNFALLAMLAEAVFAPKDMMRLHAFDMLPSSSEHLFQPDIDPTEAVVSLLRSLLKQQED